MTTIEREINENAVLDQAAARVRTLERYPHLWEELDEARAELAQLESEADPNRGEREHFARMSHLMQDHRLATAL